MTAGGPCPTIRRGMRATEAAVAATEAELVERLRSVHLAMVDAVLSGEGLGTVAELASRAVATPVAIVVPRLGVAALWPQEDAAADQLSAIARYVADRVADRPSNVPAGLAGEVPIASGDELIGAVVQLAGAGRRGRESESGVEFLHLAAVASLTEVAVHEAREEVEQNLRGSFLEDLRERGDMEPAEIVRRAGRLGCDLARGAVVLCAEVDNDRPGHLVALVSGEFPGALVQRLETGAGAGQGARIYAVLPASGGDDAPEATLVAGRRLAARLGRQGPVGLSSFYADPVDLGRAIQEAELVLDVTRQFGGDGRIDSGDIGSGTYRLLFRVLASHPEEVRSFYEDTVAPIVRYDDQYRTDLVGTLEAYLDQNCNMNATASAIYAHRHTVAYRLERVRDLTGLDPMQSEDRERLGLGLKAYRIISPQLPR